MIGGVEIGDVKGEVLLAELLGVPNCTWTVIWPSGWDALSGTMPQKGDSAGSKSLLVRPNSRSDLGKSMLRVLPPSMRTFLKCTLSITGSSTSEKCPGYGMSDHWSSLENVIGYSDHGRNFGSVMVLLRETVMIHRAISFLFLLVSMMGAPPKIVETLLEGVWKALPSLFSSSSLPPPSFSSSWRRWRFWSSSQNILLNL